MASFNFIDSDAEKLKKGVWVEHESNRFLIASPNEIDVTKKYEGYVDLIVEKKGDKHKLRSSENLICTVRMCAELILLDWDVTDSNGDKIKYSKKNAQNALINDSDFLGWVIEQSKNNDNYKKEKRAKDVKKS